MPRLARFERLRRCLGDVSSDRVKVVSASGASEDSTELIIPISISGSRSVACLLCQRLREIWRAATNAVVTDTTITANT